MGIRAIAAAAGICIVLGGCSGSAIAHPGAGTTTQPPPAAVGAAQTTYHGSSAQVISTQVVAADTAVQIRVCLGTDGGTVTNEPWSVRDIFGNVYKPTVADYGVPTTMIPFPNDSLTQYASGDCVAGWLFFQMPKGKDLQMIRYSIVDLSGTALGRFWHL